MPVRAKRPGKVSFLFKASPEMTKRTHRWVRRNGADSSASRRLGAGTNALPAHIDPTAFSMDDAASKQQLGKDGNDHSIREIR
jgi:hypothetical protein